ncbi:MAG: hypothetical protein HYV47_00545 [Candidatus Nealsonbacteria bacterium]|nr:hypothetical protein [Candidatus Nealsonbacteria bacterium]
MEKVDLCYKCKKNKVSGKGADFSFVHLGMQIKIFKWSGLCNECAKAEWIEGFERDAKEFIEVVDGKPKVNWQRYREHFNTGEFYGQRERLHSLLKDMGILSYEAKGNWEIVADGPIGLNPRSEVSYLYFTRQEDVMEFANLKYCNTLYPWEIRHIDEVIPRKEVIKNPVY